MNNQTLEDKLKEEISYPGLHLIDTVENIKQIFKDEGYVTTDVKEKTDKLVQEMVNLHARMNQDMIRLGLTSTPVKETPNVYHGTKYPDPRPCTKNSHFIEHEQSDCGCGYTKGMSK